MITRIRASLTANPLLIDAIIALSLSALSRVTVVGGARNVGGRDPLSIGLLLLLLPWAMGLATGAGRPAPGRASCCLVPPLSFRGAANRWASRRPT